MLAPSAHGSALGSGLGLEESAQAVMPPLVPKFYQLSICVSQLTDSNLGASKSEVFGWIEISGHTAIGAWNRVELGSH